MSEGIRGSSIASRIPHTGSGPVHILDKMLFNYKNVGFIHMVYPASTILHMVRDPMDNLFSAYKKKFDDQGMEWTLNIEQLVANYVEYLRIMQHYRTVLPGRVLDVPYELLVNYPRNVLPQIVEAIGLEWDESILNLQASSRVIHTHSRTQLNVGIHNASVGAWVKYAPHLEQLAAELKKYLPKLHSEGALPLHSYYNWELDPNFDYWDSVQRMALDLGFVDSEEEEEEEEEEAEEDEAEEMDSEYDVNESKSKQSQISNAIHAIHPQSRDCPGGVPPQWDWDLVQGSVGLRDDEDNSFEGVWDTLVAQFPHIKGEDGTIHSVGAAIEEESAMHGELIVSEMQANFLIESFQSTPLLKPLKSYLSTVGPQEALLAMYTAAAATVTEAGKGEEVTYLQAHTILEALIKSHWQPQSGDGGGFSIVLPVQTSHVIRVSATAAALGGKLNAARASLQTLVAQNPHDMDALKRLLEVEQALGNVLMALDITDKAIRICVEQSLALAPWLIKRIRYCCLYRA